MLFTYFVQNDQNIRNSPDGFIASGSYGLLMVEVTVNLVDNALMYL